MSRISRAVFVIPFLIGLACSLPFSVEVAPAPILSTLVAAATDTPVPPTSVPLPTATPTPAHPVGNGNVTRAALRYDDLMNASANAAIVDYSAFALPNGAAMPANTFEGTLTLSGEATSGAFELLVDDFRYDKPERRHLPKFAMQFVQDKSYLIPVKQSLQISGSNYWNYIVGPGRAWQENGDNGMTRASFPFALVERNANCTHNGMMTLLFDNSKISNVRYQIAQETCMYSKFNMWGQLRATYTRGGVKDPEVIRAAHAAELANKIPTKPIAELAKDYPKVDLSGFGSGVTPGHLTTYGVYFKGVNYVGGCATRSGEYPFCRDMRLSSYSTAKTSFTAVAFFLLAQKYGATVGDLLIRDYVPEAKRATGKWDTVTFAQTLNMATGNYQLPGDEADELGRLMGQFFAEENYNEKIAAAFVFPNKTKPGVFWSYHSSDTFIVLAAMDNFLKTKAGKEADIFNLVRDEVYAPINLSAGAMSTLRTDNSPSGKPFGGYGLFWTHDDVAKVARFLYLNDGQINGRQVMHPGLLTAAMQKNPSDRGLDTTGTITFKYQHAFWAKEIKPREFPQYSCTFYPVFQPGYGGNEIVMLPNGAIYYYFSDKGEFVWYPAMFAANALAPYCP